MIAIIFTIPTLSQIKVTSTIFISSADTTLTVLAFNSGDVTGKIKTIDAYTIPDKIKLVTHADWNTVFPKGYFSIDFELESWENTNGIKLNYLSISNGKASKLVAKTIKITKIESLRSE